MRTTMPPGHLLHRAVSKGRGSSWVMLTAFLFCTGAFSHPKASAALMPPQHDRASHSSAGGFSKAASGAGQSTALSTGFGSTRSASPIDATLALGGSLGGILAAGALLGKARWPA
jgi:hypothetical protein